MKLYKAIALKLAAMRSCKEKGNDEWFSKHESELIELCGLLPSGSGIDSGTTLNVEKSRPNKMVMTFSYHHMNERGFYTHWTDHVVKITPTLISGYDIDISKGGVKDTSWADAVWETFFYTLETNVEINGG